MARVSESRAEDAARGLLAIRGWDLARPPKGNVLWRNEYREYPVLLESLAAASKSGDGAGYPDFIVVEPRQFRPIIIGETKARAGDIDAASAEASLYASAFTKRGMDVLAVGVAGNAEDDVTVRVQKPKNGKWEPVRYRNDPIEWLPTPDEANQLLLDPTLFSLDPEVPPVEILEAKADEINRVLRECRVKDERRPAVVAAFMLAMWKTHGDLRMHPEHVLTDVNSACQKAFRDAGKIEIEDAITVDAANEALANEAYKIIRILRLLRVSTLTGAHDYLGQLYEHFFRYTGGNTIGQFFTPRHIAKFMAEMCEVTKNDVVVDPSCGTGGFLIACLYRMMGQRTLTPKQVGDIVSDHLWGFESEPTTAALCVANMILRGDGKTGVIKGDCFTDRRYPVKKADVVLGNPPFPHKKSDEQPEKFVDRGLDALKDRGEIAMVVPASMLVKAGSKRDWRARIMRRHTVRAVIKLPDELFQPYATAYTNILLIKKGTPHPADAPVFFARVENDGFRLRKNVRGKIPGEQLTDTLDAFRNHRGKPGWYAWGKLSADDWSPGEYIASVPSNDSDLEDTAAYLLRSILSFQLVHADQLRRLDAAVAGGEVRHVPYKRPSKSGEGLFKDAGEGTIGREFAIYYGQGSLEANAGLGEGPVPVISSAGTDNGCHGFYDLPTGTVPLSPPFVTVPRTGSIGDAFVQLTPCGVTSDCLVLLPRTPVPLEDLFLAAAKVRHESWRFSYGRKITPARIASFPVSPSADLRARVARRHRSVLIGSSEMLASFGERDKLREQFATLADTWRRSRRPSSTVDRLAMQDAYQQIIGMGPRAIPLLLRELEDRPAQWFWALRAITRQDPVTDDDRGNLKRSAAAWLRWGREHGYQW